MENIMGQLRFHGFLKYLSPLHWLWQRFIKKAISALEVDKAESGIAAISRPPLFSLGPSGIGGAYQVEF